jgi:hypothetical protein
MGGTDRPTLAARFVAGPKLFAPEDAGRRLADWLGDIPPEAAAAFSQARSKGTFFNREIRDRYVCRDITHEYAG